MKFIDLQKQYHLHKARINQAIQKVLDHGQFIQGPEVSQLETQLSEYINVKHAIAVSSGTTALQVALMALGIQPGDEVITTPFSFFATSETIILLGATPVYVDIDARTYNLDPALLEAAITDKTKAIMPVGLYGQCADMNAINAIAQKYQLPVIEDAAQTLGATYQGQKSCGLSTIGCTSFFPSKPLGAYGDAGACFTNDDALAEKMRMIMNHGQSSRYTHVAIGINGRCDSIQAAIMIEKLNILDDEIDKRQAVAAQYADAFGTDIKAPFIAEGNRSAYAQYTVQVEDRAQVQKALSAQGIPTAVHYPRGLHQQPIAIELFGDQAGRYPLTERASERVLSLPFHPYMEKAEVEQVANALISLQVAAT